LSSGFIQHLSQALSYGPTDLGISHLARTWQTTSGVILKASGLSQQRLWQMRAMQPIIRDAGLMCSHLLRSQHVAGRDVRWELGIERRYKGAVLFLHGRINLMHGNTRGTMPGDRVHPFYFHLDQTFHPIWVWWRYLRYLEAWAKQAKSERIDEGELARPTVFPTLLVVSPTRFRALSVGALARSLAPSVAVAITGDYAKALQHGPESARWNVILNGDRPGEPLKAISCKPFADLFNASEESRHRVKSVRDLAERFVRNKKAKSVTVAVQPYEFSCQHVPSKFVGIQSFEFISVQARRILAFLSHHSTCPPSTLQQLLSMNKDGVDKTLTVLQESELASPATFGLRNATQEPLWSASECGARLQYASEGCCDVDQHTQSYLAGVKDHLRRSEHTRAVYDFFERLHRHAEGWGRVTKPLGTNADVSEGAYYALEEFQDDVAARAMYMVAGNHRRWQPDAYGVLRCGLVRKRFWLEIDGSLVGRAHNEPTVWEAKLGALCDYAATGKWLLRHGEFPILLIVTTDLRILNLIRDVLAQAVAARHVSMPQVFVASQAAIVSRGPLAPVWKQAHSPGEDNFAHAFEPLVRTEPGIST
jgi:hypothetical protein